MEVLSLSLSLHYNGIISFLFVNATKMYLLKAKNSEIRKYPLCLGNISGEFLANNMRNSTKWVCVQFFCWLESFWYSQTYNGKTWYKIIFGLIKKNVY